MTASFRDRVARADGTVDVEHPRTATGMPRDWGSRTSSIDGIVPGSPGEAARVAPAAAARDGLEERRARLSALVETEVVPRLWWLHRTVVAPDPVGAHPVSAAEVAGFARLLSGPDPAAPAAYVSMLRGRGVGADDLPLTLLAPAARLLGTLWERDEYDLADVGIALGRLQTLLAVLDRRHAAPAPDRRRTVLLATMPEDPHSFGLSMVGGFLRGGGWTTVEEPGSTADRLAALVRGGWFDVAGLAVGSDRHLPALTTAIRSIRTASRNRAIGIMVGGPVFSEAPGLAKAVGADSTAVDAAAAVPAAGKLLDARPPHGPDKRPSLGTRIGDNSPAHRSEPAR